MPYKMLAVEGGFKIAKKDGTKMSNGRMYTSNKPMTKEKAKKQMAALEINEPQKVKMKKKKILSIYK